MKYIFENTVIDYKEGAIRKNGEKIFETAFADFGVCTDDKGNLYILCQNNKNAIYLISVSGESVSNKCLLESKNESGYEKSFCAEFVNGWINGVYVIKHEEKYLLIHNIELTASCIASSVISYVTWTEKNSFVWKLCNKISCST